MEGMASCGNGLRERGAAEAEKENSKKCAKVRQNTSNFHGFSFAVIPWSLLGTLLKTCRQLA
jgi:hypothetical protein